MAGNFVCRACRRRLSLPAAPLRAQQQYLLPDAATGRRDFSSASTATDPVSQPIQYGQIHRLSKATSGRGDAQATTTRTVTQSQILAALTGGTNVSEPPKPRRRRSKLPQNSKYSAQVDSRRKEDDTEGAAPRSSESQRQKKLVAKSRRKTESYYQWGYVRHRTSKGTQGNTEAFNFWKGWLDAITLHNGNIELAPWRDDGDEFGKLESHQAMFDAWSQVEAEERKELWPRVMLSILSKDMHKASQVLAATLDPLPPGYALADILDLIADSVTVSQLNDRKNTREADQLLDLLLRLIHHTPSGYIPFVQRTFGKFGKKLPPHHARELYGALKEAGAAIHPHTKLHFANTLAGATAKSQYKDEAFSILKELAESSEDLKKPQFASVLTSLLRCEPAGDAHAKDFSPSDAMQHFMETGHVPNIITFTAFLRTLCRRREWAEAIRLAKLFCNSVQPLDSKALQTIFHGAKSSQSSSNMRDVLEISKKSKASKVEILNNALHSVFCFADAEFAQYQQIPASDHKPFVTILAIYVKKFEMEPLQWLIPEMLPMLLERQETDVTTQYDGPSRRHFKFERTIVPVIDEFFCADGNKKLKPDATTLAIMLRAYVKSLWRPYDLMSFYSFFKMRLEEMSQAKDRHENLLLSQGSVIHDTLIQAMLKQEGLTRPALEVFGDMLKERIKKLEKKGSQGADPAESRAAVHPEPSVFTFSILLHSLFLRKETALVDQILKVMGENGIEPNLVTWNILIQGYALMQNVPKTVKALRELEATGNTPDEYTYKAFAKLKRQKEALEMIQQIIDRNAQTIEGHELPS